MTPEAQEFVYTLASHQDQTVPVWRRLANRPLVVAAKPESIPPQAIVLLHGRGDVPPEFSLKFHAANCTVLWVEDVGKF